MWIDRAERALLIGAAVAVPFWISPAGQESFRVPKEAIFLGFSVLLLAILAIRSVIFEVLPLPHLGRAGIVAVLGGIAWTGLTSILSTNPGLSLSSFGWLLCASVYFISAWHVTRDRGLPLGPIVLFPASAIAAVCLLQAFSIWSPIQTGPLDARHQVFGFLGNPNDAGAYLALALVGAVQALAEKRTVPRMLATGVILLGIGATQSLTSIAAVFAGGAVLLWKFRRFAGAGRLAVVAIVLAVLLAAYPPVTARIGMVVDQIRGERLNEATSHRVTGFRAALAMWRDRPVVGVGPGTFGWNYYDYKLRLERTDPDLLRSEMRWLKLDHVHNDHLEILAETGLPGLALWFAALVLLARVRGRTAVGGGAVLAVVLAVLALMQFPLRLAAPTLTALLLAGRAVGGGDHE